MDLSPHARTFAHPTAEEMTRAVRLLAEQTGAQKRGTAANRAVKQDDPEIRQRVVGLEDWRGVPRASQLESDQAFLAAMRTLRDSGTWAA
jgi:hypothetical protein